MLVAQADEAEHGQVVNVNVPVCVTEAGADGKVVRDEPGKARGGAGEGYVAVHVVDDAGQGDSLGEFFAGGLPAVVSARQGDGHRPLGNIEGLGVAQPAVDGGEGSRAGGGQQQGQDYSNTFHTFFALKARFFQPAK